MKNFVKKRVSSQRRILQLAHSHPKFHPGGTELVALALHREALRRGEDSWYLGAIEPSQRTPNPGTHMMPISDDNREAAIYCGDFRRFELSQDDRYGSLREFHEFLRYLKPDVVHVHHVLNFGLEALLTIRTCLPEAVIILTLHDFYLICANNGQLFKYDTKERCEGPDLDECLKCFPKRTSRDFALRQIDISHALSVCDHLIAPSHLLRIKMEQYLPKGYPVRVIENGYLGPSTTTTAHKSWPLSEGYPITFGYFGNISAVKGLGDMLQAAKVLTREGFNNFLVHIHGSQLFEDKCLFELIAESEALLDGRLVQFGKYDHASLPGRMSDIDVVVFPSIWWENAPLVVYEALFHGKQTISYPHGGAAEILKRYETGLISARSDPQALADTMRTVLEDSSLLAFPILAQTIPDTSSIFNAYDRVYRESRATTKLA